MNIDQEVKAHLTRDLRALLVIHNYPSFRLQVSFQQEGGNNFNYKRTFYGDEHRCTYNQLVAGYKKEIVLIKQLGYQALINKIEKDYCGKYSYATIYMRTDHSGKDFPIMCRQYCKDVENLKLRNDPLLSPDEGRIVYFTIAPDTGRLQLHNEDPAQVDFAKEIVVNLEKNIPQL